jgi:hypothetical protein
MLHNLQAQVKSGLENYHSISRGASVTWMPVLHYMNKDGWYTEARYNYEDINTGSFYLGKSFSGGHELLFTITPMAGIILGKYNGAALASNCDLSYKKYFFSGQLQYALSKTGNRDNFFYQWSEFGVECTNWFFTGVTVQQTKLYKQRMATIPGLMFGFQKKNISVPVYIFNPFKNETSLLLGIIIEWEK